MTSELFSKMHPGGGLSRISPQEASPSARTRPLAAVERPSSNPAEAVEPAQRHAPSNPAPPRPLIRSGQSIKPSARSVWWRARLPPARHPSQPARNSIPQPSATPAVGPRTAMLWHRQFDSKRNAVQAWQIISTSRWPASANHSVRRSLCAKPPPITPAPSQPLEKRQRRTRPRTQVVRALARTSVGDEPPSQRQVSGPTPTRRPWPRCCPAPPHTPPPCRACLNQPRRNGDARGPGSQPR